MAEFVDRQRKSRESNRPAVTFTRRDDVRDLMKTPRGQNYGNMLDLQSQAIRRGGFDKGDPKVAELKAARRQYNRQDKRAIGELMGYSPTDVQDIYRQNSGVLRKYAKPTYNRMYPISGGIMDIGEKGGILGAILSEIGKMGKDKGLPTMVDDTEEEQIKYVTDTFGPHLKDEDIEELDFTEEYAGRLPHEGLPTIKEQIKDLDLPPITDELWDSIRDFDPGTIGGGGKLHSGDDITVPDWLTDPSIPMPDELVEGEYLPGEYHDELIEEEVPAALSPYYDPKTESGIANLMPGGPLYDAIPMGQRLNMRIAEQMRERGPHRNEPRTSYYGSNWYDEYKRKLENEMEVNRGIRAPIDR